MREIVAATVEPDWCMVYVDGELWGDGHKYQESDIVYDAVNGADEPCTITQFHFNPDEWRGSPDTLAEAVEVYALPEHLCNE